MRFLDILRPAFSRIAHRRVALSGRIPDPTPSGGTGTADWERMIADAKQELLLDPSPHAGDAWFAFAAWAADDIPAPENADAAFYPRLESLLSPPPDAWDNARASAIEVFTACLELGYRGRGDGDPTPDAYRERCREALHLARAAGRRQTESAGPGRRRLLPAVAAFAVWMVPPVVAILLYASYRVILGRQLLAVFE